jgi:sugar lactone lactonase YvrE
MACDPDGRVYVTRKQYIYYIDEEGSPQIYAGDQPGDRLGHRLQRALFSEPHGLCWTAEHILYFSDRENHKIKCIKDDQVSLVAGTNEGKKDGPVTKAEFSRPYGVCELNGTLYVTDWGDTIRVIADGMVTTLGTGDLKSKDGPFHSACFHFPTGITPGLNNTILVTESTGCSIRVLDLEKGMASKLVGRNGERLADGDLSSAALGLARGIACLPNGDIYFCDRSSHMIRHISGGQVKSLLRMSEENTSPRQNIIYDEPSYPYTTTFPSAICFTPDGALWWAETGGYACSIPDVIPPFGKLKLPSLPSLLALCDAPDLFPTDLTFQLGQSAANATLEMHSYILELNPDVSVAKLKSALGSSRQPQYASLLRPLLYGDDNLMVQEEPVATFLDLLELVVDCGINNLAEWLLNRLYLHKSISKSQDIVLAFQKNLPKDHPAHQLLQTLLDALSQRYGSFPNLGISSPTSLDSQIPPDAEEEPKHTPKKSEPHAFSRGTPPSPSQVINSTIALTPLKNDKPKDPSGLKFTISTESSAGKGLSISVHSWLLYCRWPYFQRMMSTGFCEMTARVLDLPSEFPANLLSCLLQYICTGVVDITNMDESDCIFVFLNGAEYNLTDFNREPLPQFHPFVAACKKRFFEPLSLENFPRVKERIEAYGTPSMQADLERFRVLHDLS